MPTVLEAFVRGDTFVYEFTLGNGWLFADFEEIWFTLRRRHSLSTVVNDAEAIAQATALGGGIVVDEDDADVGIVTIAASLTTLWPSGQLVWDLQGRRDTGIIETIDRGTLEILSDVTRST